MKSVTFAFIFSFFMVFVLITSAIIYTDNRNNEHLEHYIQVEIEEGDSIWSLADKYDETSSYSKQEFVIWVQEKNDIDRNIVKPGELVILPVEKKQMYQIEQLASE